MEQDKVIPLDTQRRLMAYQTAKSWEEVPPMWPISTSRTPRSSTRRTSAGGRSFPARGCG